MASSKGYRHWVKAKPRSDIFPFSYNITVIEPDLPILEKINEDLMVEFFEGNDLKVKIKEALVMEFPFYKYLDISSKDYIGKPNDLVYNVRVNFYIIEEVFSKSGKTSKKVSKLTKSSVVKLDNFSTEYQFNLITSLDKLEELLKPNYDEIAFDLETTGLNPDEDYIVGAILSMEPKVGYYIPIKHDIKFKDINLGYDGLDLIYDALVRASIVDTFNGRFDMRMMEYSERHYDMSKVKVADVQIYAWFADPDYKKHDLKSLEKHFLGYYRPNLATTMKTYGLGVSNANKINPKYLLFYGAMDGISTLELACETRQFFIEFGISAQIDQKFLYPLMKMENHSMRIDIDYLKEQLDIIVPRLAELDETIKEQIGDVNLNSPAQKVALFKSFGLDTLEKTETGQMATGNKQVDKMMQRMRARGEKIPYWLTLLEERSKLDKLNTTFFRSLYKQALLNEGRVRINYRNTVVSTGRLSSGKEEEY